MDWHESHLILLKAGLAPDAFIQMALQLTWFRNQGYATATYETASTRIFNNGRTETLRTLTSESKTFVESMMSKDVDVWRAFSNLPSSNTPPE